MAAAFSNSSSPVCPGESRWAAMPEPITTAAKKALTHELGQQPPPQQSVRPPFAGPGSSSRSDEA